jgi:uncharacterized paraquat-inducible protein A
MGWVIFLIILAIVVIGILISRRGSRIVKCTNCGFRMTYNRFRKNGGCIRCGTDLYEETGERPRNRRIM